MHPGLSTVCIREVQKSLKDSAKKLLEVKINDMGVGPMFEIQRDIIKTPGGGQIIFQGMQDHTAESVKSLEGFGRAWVEEAQTLSSRSLELLRPTIRAPGSQIHFTWNPRRKADPVDVLLRQMNHGDDAIVVKANWNNNPWFPEELEKERLFDLKNNPDRYEHIWEGAYATAFSGAYYANLLADAEREGRIVDDLPIDPVLPIYAFHDIGGAGRSADHYSIWVVQFVGGFANVLDHYTAQGQVLSYHISHMRSVWPRSIQILPHDGANTDKVVGKTVADHWRDGGFDVPKPVPNQGRGAAKLRIEAGRRILPNCRFVREKTESGRLSLGFYHEKRDDTRDIGLGPDHDWSSHDADAFGLMAIKFDDLSSFIKPTPIVVPNFGAV